MGRGDSSGAPPCPGRRRVTFRVPVDTPSGDGSRTGVRSYEGYAAAGMLVAARGLTERQLAAAAAGAYSLAGSWLWERAVLKGDGWTRGTDGLWRPALGDERAEYAVGERTGAADPDPVPVADPGRSPQPAASGGAGRREVLGAAEWREWWLDPREGWGRREAVRCAAIGAWARRRGLLVAHPPPCPVCGARPCMGHDWRAVMSRKKSSSPPAAAAGGVVVGAALVDLLAEIGERHVAGASPAIVLDLVFRGLPEDESDPSGRGVGAVVERGLQRARREADTRFQERRRREQAERSASDAGAAPPRTEAAPGAASGARQADGGAPPRPTAEQRRVAQQRP